jgi:hypothetical protein
VKARGKVLCNHSIGMALSAIEIYNKPNFHNREQIFCILIVSAWETLLKARIVSLNGNSHSSIYLKNSNGRYKKNRNNEYLTIGLDEAIFKLSLNTIISENILQLVRIRDAAIHLTAESKTLPYLVFSLGTASLQNYSKLIRGWFSEGLGDYNFYILPLGFSYPFRTITNVEFRREPESISAIVADIEKCSARHPADGEYFFVCEIRTALISAKKIAENTDLIVKVDNASVGSSIVTQKVNLIDQYSYTWNNALEKLQKEIPDLKRKQFSKFIEDHKIKTTQKYAAYNYRSKQEEQKGPQKTTTVIYSEEFIKYAISILKV